jgi:putative SOS response-associated peptidase YedK
MSRATGDLLSQFEAEEIEGSPPPPSWNVAPTQDVTIIAERLDEGSVDRRLLFARWGLVPSWAKDIKIGSRLINARRESVLDKPLFRKAAVKRRALVPAEGYYEWQKTEDGKKIPKYLYSDTEMGSPSPGCMSSGPTRSFPRMTRNGGCSAAPS